MRNDGSQTAVIVTAEYAAKKNRLISEKVALTEKIVDIEQRGASWLEPAREFVKSLNQAAKLIESENLSEMTIFLKTSARTIFYGIGNFFLP